MRKPLRCLALVMPVLFFQLYVTAQTAFPVNLVNMNGTLYYASTNASHGQELWKSDGTMAGTILVKDINPGTGNGSPQQLTVVGNILFFSAVSGTAGRELWRSDGTDAGTFQVKDIMAGVEGSSPDNMIALGGNLYFVAEEGLTGRELWRSDGTDAGTVMLKEIYPGTGWPQISHMTVAGNTLFFSANDNSNGMELWKTDGTSAGTVMVKNINPGSFGAGSNPGSVAGEPGNIKAVGSLVYFTANDGTNGVELWKSDGTDAGTVMIRDINPGSDGLNNKLYMAQLGSNVFFAAYTNTFGTELWKTDGTEAGTVLVKDINAGADLNTHPQFLTVAGNYIYFKGWLGFGEELYRTDGTEAGTVLIKDINPGMGGSAILFPTAIGSTLYFRANNGTHAIELWKSDGTESGTVMVKDIYPAFNSSLPDFLTPIGNILYFSADDGTNGKQLWKTDGTAAGTVMVKDVAGTTVATGTVASPLCTGSSFNVPFTISGSFNAGNSFTAQLSDAAGAFTSPVSIGTLTSGIAGNISVTIPSGTAAGSGYRIRVIASNPSSTGTDNGSNIIISAPPVANISAPSSSFCAGSSVLLTASAGNLYLWKKDGTDINGATSQTYSVTTPGNYSVVVSSIPGCGNTSSAVTITTTPTTLITAQPVNVTVCTGGPASFTISATGASLTYQWRKNGTAISGATTSAYSITSAVASDAGTYDVEVTGTCGSQTSGTGTLTVNTCTALPRIDADIKGAVLMPNVTNDQTILRLVAGHPMVIDINLVDGQGKKLKQWNRKLNSGRNDILIELKEVPAGIYYIQGHTSNGRIEILKLLKH